MRSILKHIVSGVLLAAAMATTAMATDHWVVVVVAAGANVNNIAGAYNGKVLDALPGNTYLLDVKQLTPKYPVTGVLSMDSTTLVSHGHSTGGVVSIRPGTNPDW